MSTDQQNAAPKRGYIQHTSAGQTLTPCAIKRLVSPCKADTWPNLLAIQAQPYQSDFAPRVQESTDSTLYGMLLDGDCLSISMSHAWVMYRWSYSQTFHCVKSCGNWHKKNLSLSLSNPNDRNLSNSNLSSLLIKMFRDGYQNCSLMKAIINPMKWRQKEMSVAN